MQVPIIQHVRSLLRRFVRSYVLSPKPYGLKKCGIDTYIYIPRRINGSRYIELGDRSTVDKFSWLSAINRYADEPFTPKIQIGNDVHIGRFACITSIDSIIIEDGCLFSEYVYISDHGHGIDPEAGLLVNQKLLSKGEVYIGPNTFVGYRACIMPGVRLGKHCVVGANSVVTSSFPDYSMIAGCPARVIKIYSTAEKKWLATEKKISASTYEP